MDENAGRWVRLEALFAAAADLPRPRQTAFIEKATASEPDLGHELQILLDHDTGARSRIEQAIHSAASPAGSLEWIRRRVGPYRIVREVGRGGMGLVFEAVRDDDEYRKTVALKVAPWWCDLAFLRERFRRERQILSGLEHPNIARLLDGGTHGGVTYFAMEFVEGLRITDYARDLKLPDKIELFRDVCAAVQYAHQSLVVHRDLKPSNILVNKEGVPKLLDFGIAKLLNPLEEDATATRAALWTPDYASPEQVRARPVTTRTDVYSLGLILFEMLTGEKAQIADTSTPLALDGSICQKETPLASHGVAARGDRALARHLEGDLDTIVATATRKEPDRRYGSVAALSDDLGRFLKGLPIEARPGTFGYRTGKLLRRHLIGAVATLLILVAIVGGALTILYQARRAERRFQQVRSLANTVLFGVHDRLRNLAGATETREWAVRTALEYLDDLSKDTGRDESMLKELAAAYLQIGDVQGYPFLPNLGHREAAMISYRKAANLAERIETSHRGPEARRLLARSHQRIAAMLRTFGQTKASIEEYQRAFAEAKPLLDANPNPPDDVELLCTILLTLGQAEAVTGNVTEASGLWMRGESLRERLASAKGSDPLQTKLVRTEKYVIRALMYSGDLEAAERTAVEGVRTREIAAGREPGNAALRRDLGNSYGELAYIYFHSSFLSYGDREKAAMYQQKSLEITRDLAAADPSNATAQADLSITEVDLCAALAAGAPAKAIGYCRDGLDLAARWPQLNPEGGLSQLADALARLGRPREALKALRSAIQMRQDLGRRDPAHFVIRQQLLRGYNQMAALLLATGDVVAARAQHIQAVALAEELVTAVPGNLLARRDLADTYEAFGRYFEGRDWSQSRAWYQKSLDIWTDWPRLAPAGRMDKARRLNAQLFVARCVRMLHCEAGQCRVVAAAAW